MKYERHVVLEGKREFKVVFGSTYWWGIPDVKSGSDPDATYFAALPHRETGIRLVRGRHG